MFSPSTCDIAVSAGIVTVFSSPVLLSLYIVSSKFVAASNAVNLLNSSFFASSVSVFASFALVNIPFCPVNVAIDTATSISKT